MSRDIKPVPVVCDTNVLVSALLGSFTNRKIFDVFKSGKVLLVFSKESLAELVEVLSRPQFKIPASEIRSLFRLVRKRARIVRNIKPITMCRDPKDNMILAAAVSGKAAYLVTGDQDILALSNISTVQIVPPAKFLTLVT